MKISNLICLLLSLMLLSCDLLNEIKDELNEINNDELNINTGSSPHFDPNTDTSYIPSRDLKLFYAINTKEPSKVQEALNAGANVNALPPASDPSYNLYPLRYAVILGDDDMLEVVKLLLRSGAEVNLHGSDGKTALWALIEHWVSTGELNGNRILEYLLNAGANTEIKADWIGYSQKYRITPLFQLIALTIPRVADSTQVSSAKLAAKTQAIELMLAAAADLNSTNTFPRQSTTGLNAAMAIYSKAYTNAPNIRKYFEDTILQVYNRGMNLAYRNSQGSTVLHYAAEVSEADIFQRNFLNRNNVSELLNLVNADGYSPLMLAGKRDLNLTKKILEKGANLNLSQNGKTVLSYAIEAGKKKIVDYLIDTRNARLVSGDVLRATKVDDPAILEKILSSDTSHIDETDSEGRSPLLLAAKAFSTTKTRILKEKGANLLLRNNSNKNILTIGAANSLTAQNAPFFTYVLDQEEVHPLVQASDLFKVSKLDIMKDLVDMHSLSITASSPPLNSNDENLLFSASLIANLDMAKYLIQKGVSPTVKNQYDASIFHAIRIDPSAKTPTAKKADQAKILAYIKYFYTLNPTQQIPVADLSSFVIYPDSDLFVSHGIYGILRYFEHYSYTDIVDYLKTKGVTKANKPY